MVLEACMLCLDNSAYARDGDLAPSRLTAQEETAGLVAGAKTSMHHENAVGVLTFGGDSVTVHLSPTNDMGAVLSALHGLRCGGENDFIHGIQIAQLALKHRMNKNQKQRIIAFLGSPLRCTEKQLVTLGKQLKKNNVAVDIISFGEIEANAAKLKVFHEAVDSNGTSCVLECAPLAGQLMSDVVLQSRLLHDADAAADGGALRGAIPGAPSAAAGGDFGVDPAADPELYMALQLSLQEEQQRMQQQTAVEGSDGGGSNAAAGGAAASAPQSGGSATTTAAAAGTGSGAANGVPTAAQIEMMEGIDDELRQALLLSLQDYSEEHHAGAAGLSTADAVDAPAATAAVEDAAAMDVDMLATGQVCSTGDETTSQKSKATAKAPDTASATAETSSAPPAGIEAAPASGSGAPAEQAAAGVSEREAGASQSSELAQVLSTLPGVDLTDPRMQEALREAATNAADVSEAEKREGTTATGVEESTRSQQQRTGDSQGSISGQNQEQGKE